MSSGWSPSCFWISWQQYPPWALSSLWEPVSTICPFFITQMRSALMTVDSLCAITIMVGRYDPSFLARSSMEFCTICSLLESRAEVASSKMMILGLRISALAIDIRCLCPPLRCPPFSPTSVSNPLGNCFQFLKNSMQPALSAAFSRSGMEKSVSPQVMLSRMEPENMVASWLTSPICLRRQVALMSCWSWWSNRMRPDSIWQNFSISFTMVDLPDPLSPTNAMYSPRSIFSETSRNTAVLEVGQRKVTLSSSTAPEMTALEPLASWQRGWQSSMAKTFCTAQVPLMMLVQLLEMAEVELASVVQYMMKEVSSPAVSSLWPSITISPPYQRTIRMPMQGRNSLQLLQIPVQNIFFRFMWQPFVMTTSYSAISRSSVEQAFTSCMPPNFSATVADISACTSWYCLTSTLFLLLYCRVMAEQMGTRSMTREVSFQLMVKRMMMLEQMMTTLRIRQVRLLLTADLAWLTSEERRLTSQPDLYCSKKQRSLLMKRRQKSLRMSIARNYCRNCRLRKRRKVNSARQPTRQTRPVTLSRRSVTFLVVSNSEAVVMQSSTLPTFSGRRLTDIAKQTDSTSPRMARNLRRMVYSNNLRQIGQENFFSFSFPPFFPFPAFSYSTGSAQATVESASSSAWGTSLSEVRWRRGVRRWEGRGSTSSTSRVGIFISIGRLHSYYNKEVAMHYDWKQKPTSPRLPAQPSPLPNPTRNRPLQHPVPHSPRTQAGEQGWTPAQTTGKFSKVRGVGGEKEGRAGQGAEEGRMRELVWAALSSADRVVKAVLAVGLKEVDHHCSAYLLNKEKLSSFLQDNPLPSPSRLPRSPLRLRDDDEPTESIPIGHLTRLEKIVSETVIPLLQEELEHQRRRSMRRLQREGGRERGRERGEGRAGLEVVDRLKGQDRMAVDECAEILEKFIARIMEKEEKMMAKLSKLQEKLDCEVAKTEALAAEARKWEERGRGEKDLGRERKALMKYQDMWKEVKALVGEKGADNEKDSFEDVISQLKKIVSEGRKEKRCDHRHREKDKEREKGADAHASCREDASRNEHQLRSLKEVVKTLDQEIGNLRQQGQLLADRLSNSNEKLAKLQQKARKLSQENDSANSQIERLMQQNSYKNKLIEEYLRIVSKLEESVKELEAAAVMHRAEAEQLQETIAAHAEERQSLLHHIQDAEDRERHAQEMLEQKETEMEELLQSYYGREREIREYVDRLAAAQRSFTELEKEKESLENRIADRDAAIGGLEKRIEELGVAIRDSEETIQQLRGKLNEQESKVLEKINFAQDSSDRQEEPKTQPLLHAKTTYLSIDTPHELHIISHSHSQPDSPTQVPSLRQLDSLKHKMRKLFEQNGELKFQLEKLQLELAVKNYAQEVGKDKREGEPLPKEEREELNYLRGLVYNFTGRGSPLAHKREERNQEQYRHSSNYVQLPPTNEQVINHQIFSQVQQQLSSQKQQPPKTLQQDLAERENDENMKEPQCEVVRTEEIKIEEEVGEEETEMPAEISEHYKIQQLLDLNHRLGDQLNKLENKLGGGREECQSEMQVLREELEGMSGLLNLCKKTTLKKLKRLKKTEFLRKEAQDEVERLKHRLDDALVTNQLISNIQSNTDGSGFTLPDHLQSFFRQNNPFLEFAHNAHNTRTPKSPRTPINPKPSQQIHTQTDAQPQKRSLPVVAAESEVINVVQKMHQMAAKAIQVEQQANRSFIDYLQSMQAAAETGEKSPKIESMLQSIDKQVFEDSNEKHLLLPQSQGAANENPEVVQSAIRHEGSLDEIGNKITFHREQLVNLHKLLRQQTEMQKRTRSDGYATPNRQPLLEKEDFLEGIQRAPEKEKEQSSVEEVKEMFTHRQEQLETLLIEKQQEIDRLKAIIRTLTKAQEIEDRPSPSNSRCHHREVEQLKTQNQQLWQFLEKEKGEIERLQILIKQFKLAEQMHGQQTHTHRHHHPTEEEEEERDHAFIVEDGVVVHEAHHSRKEHAHQLHDIGEEIERQIQQEEQKGEVQPSQQQLPRIQLVQQAKEPQEEVEAFKNVRMAHSIEVDSPASPTPDPKRSDSPRRFSRKADSPSPSPSPRRPARGGWQQLFPEFTGGKR